MDQNKLDEALRAAARDILGAKASDIRVGLIAGEMTGLLEDDEASTTELVTMGPGGVRGMISRKPSNVRLNVRKALDFALSAVIAATGGLHFPYPGALVALYLLNRVAEPFEFALDEQHAAVLWTLWVNRDKNTLTVARDGLLVLVHHEQKDYGRTQMSQGELDDRLAELARIGSIELTSDLVTVRERVAVRFS